MFIGYATPLPAFWLDGKLQFRPNSSKMQTDRETLLPVLIITATKQEVLARKIAKLLVTSRLAAAVQIDTVDSFYRWNEQVQNHTEFKLTIKTIRSHFAKIEELIKREHTYDIPQIIMLEIKDGSADYLQWIEQQVS